MRIRTQYKKQYTPSGFQAIKSFSWMGKSYNKAPDYYHEVVMTMPIENGEMMGRKEHLDALSNLTLHGIYISDGKEGNDIYVDDWLINAPSVAHRHREFGQISTPWNTGVVEAQMKYGCCELCLKVMPGEIAMMRNFYLLDGV